MNIQCIRVACVPAAAAPTGRRKRGRFENDGGSCGAGGPGRAIACGVRGGMRAGFRSDQARSEEESGGQRPAGQARGEEEGGGRPGGPEAEGGRAAEEGRRPRAARPEEVDEADVREAALVVGARGLREEPSLYVGVEVEGCVVFVVRRDYDRSERRCGLHDGL